MMQDTAQACHAICPFSEWERPFLQWSRCYIMFILHYEFDVILLCLLINSSTDLNNKLQHTFDLTP